MADIYELLDNGGQLLTFSAGGEYYGFYILSVADIIDLGRTPDVIWIERREEGDVAAGVWQIDHYEMVGGGVVDDLGEEIAEAPEAYNTKWRCWYPTKPTDEQRKEVQWDA